MSFLLFGAGAVAVVAGIAMVGFGIPVSEFSFGNTLIIAGTTAVVGGLIVIGLGSAVGHLRRIADELAARTPSRSGRPFDLFEPGRAGAAAGRIPFPPKPKAETGMREPLPAAPRSDFPAPVGAPFKDEPPQSFAPSLPNPDEPPVTVEDDVSLSPQHPAPTAAQAPVDFDEAARQAPSFGAGWPKPDETQDEAREFDTGWHAPPPPAEPPPARQPHTTFFDTMWPAEPKPAKSPAAREEAPPPAFEQPLQETASAPAEPVEEPAPPVVEDEPRAVAILKSGVVDGMGYTLYVDGSIEAELPHGTLRFASINELRSHLEKTS